MLSKHKSLQTGPLKTIYKGSLRVELDRDEYYPDDPGLGTPAMVYQGTGPVHYATYECAAETGELDDLKLTQDQQEWLWSLEPEIDAFLEQE